MTKIKLGIVGATGRMGQELIKAMLSDQSFELAATLYSSHFSKPNLEASPLGVLDDDKIKEAFGRCQVMVDFSHPKATKALLKAALMTPKPLVIGTTGLAEEDFELLEQVSKHAPLVYARNTSIGIALLQSLIPSLTQVLGAEFDIELSETHHRHKKDSPSGTCLMLAETVAEARGVRLDEVARFSRQGSDTPRVQGEIGFSVKRGGGTPGEHTISFLGEDESLEITHRSFSKHLFAQGALKAVQWIVSQPVGLYSMQDVLGLRS